MCIIALFFHLLWIFRSDDVLFAGVEEEWRWVTSRTNNQQIHFPNTKISFLEAGYIIGRQQNHSFKDANFTKIEEKPCSTCRSFSVSLHPWMHGSASLYVVYPASKKRSLCLENGFVSCSFHSSPKFCSYLRIPTIYTWLWGPCTVI